MAAKPVILVGGGGHAKVVADIFLQQNVEIAGCVCLPGDSHLDQVRWLGNDDVLDSMSRSEYKVHVALGSNRLRQKLAMQACEMGFELETVISRQAIISPRAHIGAGVAIMPGAVVNAGATIGIGAIINTSASIDHDCQIGDFAHIAPGSHLAGNVTVEKGAFLGTGTSVIPGITIAQWAIIGAGAVVICRIPEGETAVGVPARIIKRSPV